TAANALVLVAEGAQQQGDGRSTEPAQPEGGGGAAAGVRVAVGQPVRPLAGRLPVERPTLRRGAARPDAGRDGQEPRASQAARPPLHGALRSGKVSEEQFTPASRQEKCS